jgi:hypothetical protein
MLMKLEFFRQILEKYSIIKFNKNLSIGSRVFPCGRQVGMTKLAVAFVQFYNAPKIGTQSAATRAYSILY